MVSSLKGYVLKITEKPYPGRPFRNIVDAETINGKFMVNLREISGKLPGKLPGSSWEAPCREAIGRRREGSQKMAVSRRKLVWKVSALSSVMNFMAHVCKLMGSASERARP